MGIHGKETDDDGDPELGCDLFSIVILQGYLYLMRILARLRAASDMDKSAGLKEIRTLAMSFIAHS